MYIKLVALCIIGSNEVALSSKSLVTPGLDVNDACKCPIINLRRHFCLWQNHTNAHNP